MGERRFCLAMGLGRSEGLGGSDGYAEYTA
jgi:hypothetical protein